MAMTKKEEKEQAEKLRAALAETVNKHSLLDFLKASANNSIEKGFAFKLMQRFNLKDDG